MIRMIALSLMVLVMPGCTGAGRGSAVAPGDVGRLTGELWKGQLTYLDYSSGERTTIPSTLRVSPGAGEREWIFAFGYTDEPQADGAATIALSEDGRRINEEAVIERTAGADGSVRIVTRERGEDNNRPAWLRFVYEIRDDAFSITKFVRYDGETEEFERNTFRWTR